MVVIKKQKRILAEETKELKLINKIDRINKKISKEVKSKKKTTLESKPSKTGVVSDS